MRFIWMHKADEESEADVPPSAELIARMGRLMVSPDGLRGFVRFTVDESEPRPKVVPIVRSRRPRPWPES
jgi:hypothetical protein